MNTYPKYRKMTCMFQKMVLLLILCCAVIPAYMVLPYKVGAQTTDSNPKDNPPATYTLLEPLPCISDGTNKCAEGDTLTKVNFADYVQYIFNLIIAISAVAAVLVIVAGGFKYVTTDSFQGKDEGKKMIQEALKGLLLVLCSYLILRTIDPRLVAIPSTIVAPLNIKYEKGYAASFFGDLSKKSSEYKKIATVSLNAATEAQAATNALTSDLEAKKKTLPENSSEAKAIQTQIDKIKNTDDYKNKEYTTKVELAKVAMFGDIQNVANKVAEMFKNDSRLNPLDTNKVNSEFEKSIAYVDDVRARVNADLKNIGAPAETIALVDTQANYAQSILIIEKTKGWLDRAVVKKNPSDGSTVGVSFSEYLPNTNIYDARTMFIDELSRAQVKVSGIKDPILRSKEQRELTDAYRVLTSKFGTQ